MDAQIPFAKITEGSRPDLITSIAKAFSDSYDCELGKGGGGGIAAKVREGVQHDVLEFSLVGEPLDMLERLARHRDFSVLLPILGLGMEEYDHRAFNRLIDILVRNLGQCL